MPRASSCTRSCASTTEQLEKLEGLPGEVGSGMFGGMSMAMGDGDTTEQIDENPLAFAAQVAADSLRPYDPKASFAGKVDAKTGPVGVRLAAARLLTDGRSELELEGFATHVPNLGDLSERVFLTVTSVEGKAGQELLAAETCGPDRNDKPAPLAPSFGGEVLTGSKKVRLSDGATPERRGPREGRGHAAPAGAHRVGEAGGQGKARASSATACASRSSRAREATSPTR